MWRRRPNVVHIRDDDFLAIGGRRIAFIGGRPGGNPIRRTIPKSLIIRGPTAVEDVEHGGHSNRMLLGLALLVVLDESDEMILPAHARQVPFVSDLEKDVIQIMNA